MITICKIKYIETASTARIETNIKTDGKPDFLLFVEVEKEWGKYLVTDRADAFLVGILHRAMYDGHDIKCEVPVSAELKYGLEQQIHILSKYDSKLHAAKIYADLTDTPLKNAGAVGTGLSLGLDSFATIAEKYDINSSSSKLTHLLTFVRTWGCMFGKGNRDFCAKKLYEKEKKAAAELNLPLIPINTNLEQYMLPWGTTYCTYCLIMVVMSLGKLFRAYYISSLGLDFSYFNIRNTALKDCSSYELLTINSCSIQGGVRFLSGGGEKDKVEKFKVISKFPVAKKYLHSCPGQHYNCMYCFKCRRNLICLDALDLLDDFSEVYDIPYYRSHRGEYIEWMCQQAQLDTHEFEFLEPAYNLLRQKEPELIEKYTFPIKKIFSQRNEFMRMRNVYQKYAKMYRELLTIQNWEEKLKSWFLQKNIKEVIIYGNGSATLLLEGIADRLGINIPYVVEDLRRGGGV